MAVARTFTVTFTDGKVGRKRGIGPVSFVVKDRRRQVAEVEMGILRAVTPHLASRGVEVEFALDTETGRGVGQVYAGFHSVATFDVEATP